MAVSRRIARYDIVELMEPVDEHAAGERGGVLELYEDGTAMVELTSLPADVGVDGISSRRYASSASCKRNRAHSSPQESQTEMESVLRRGRESPHAGRASHVRLHRRAYHVEVAGDVVLGIIEVGVSVEPHDAERRVSPLRPRLDSTRARRAPTSTRRREVRASSTPWSASGSSSTGCRSR